MGELFTSKSQNGQTRFLFRSGNKNQENQLSLFIQNKNRLKPVLNPSLSYINDYDSMFCVFTIKTMLTVPMAIAGALLSLWVMGQTLNIFSEIGMILLIGIVTKNGILIVEFANQKRKLGMNKRVAAFEAASARFRPILMTSLATIFGALPIALALGAGSTSRVPLGIVVVGGLLFSLLLTLFVIPVTYIMCYLIS